ncbi:MAG: hypothetical protein NTX25_18190, partial [Proteobacteria bacterium]|nr:hypothetical protein [Pseudomonadota bacterium]
SLIVSCSSGSKKLKGSTSRSESSAIAKNLTPDDEHLEINREDNLQKSFSELLEAIAENVNSDSFTVDGLSFDGMDVQLENLQAAAEGLDDTYGTIGEYISANDINIDSSLSSDGLHEVFIELDNYVNQQGSWEEFNTLVELVNSADESAAEELALAVTNAPLTDWQKAKGSMAACQVKPTSGNAKNSTSCSAFGPTKSAEIMRGCQALTSTMQSNLSTVNDQAWTALSNSRLESNNINPNTNKPYQACSGNYEVNNNKTADVGFGWNPTSKESCKLPANQASAMYNTTAGIFATAYSQAFQKTFTDMQCGHTK